METIYDLKWGLFLGAEILFWLLIVIFLVTRYWFELERISQWCIVFVILSNVFQAFLAGVDIYYKGEVSIFQIVIIIFIFYAVTYGSKDFQKLDRFIRKKVSTYKNKRTDARQISGGFSSPSNEEVRAYVKQRKVLFQMNLVAFIILHFIWTFIFANEMLQTMSLIENVYYWYEWAHHPLLGIYSIPTLNLVSYIWGIVLLFDLMTILVLSKLYKRSRE